MVVPRAGAAHTHQMRAQAATVPFPGPAGVAAEMRRGVRVCRLLVLGRHQLALQPAARGLNLSAGGDQVGDDSSREHTFNELTGTHPLLRSHGAADPADAGERE